jgi:protein-disulfide isomerase
MKIVSKIPPVAAIGLVVLAAAGIATWQFDVLKLIATSVCAERPSIADLMQAGPLGEKSLGEVSAPIIMIEYASLTCSHCARFARNVYPVLKSRYIESGKVRYIIREAPTDPLALAAAALARCVDDDKYFDFVDALFGTQVDWAFAQDPKAGLLRVAKQAGVTEQSFEEALANQRVLDGIEWVARRAHENFCVDGTPTFFINGTIHRGEISVDELDKLLQPYLKI